MLAYHESILTLFWPFSRSVISLQVRYFCTKIQAELTIQNVNIYILLNEFYESIEELSEPGVFASLYADCRMNYARSRTSLVNCRCLFYRSIHMACRELWTASSSFAHQKDHMDKVLVSFSCLVCKAWWIWAINIEFPFTPVLKWVSFVHMEYGSKIHRGYVYI